MEINSDIWRSEENFKEKGEFKIPWVFFKEVEFR